MYRTVTLKSFDVVIVVKTGDFFGDSGRRGNGVGLRDGLNVTNLNVCDWLRQLD